MSLLIFQRSHLVTVSLSCYVDAEFTESEFEDYKTAEPADDVS